MTEKTGNSARCERHLIDPVAFFTALLGAPLLVALAGFWAFMIPVAALIFGGPAYLLIAPPVLLWWLGRAEVHAGQIAGLAFLANLAACAVLYLAGRRMGVYDAPSLAWMYLIFGSIFAPLWAGVFAWLYRWLRRPFYLQTL